MSRELQDALNTIARHLSKAADGAESAPDVNFNVSWINVSTFDRKRWEPMIELSATCTRTINISEI